MYKNFTKRLMDLIISVILVIIILPIFLFFIVLLAIYYKGNPFFTQNRPGMGEKIFLLLKFKSMIERFDDQGNLLPDAQRITAMGRFIRKTSIDEIPQLLNVVKGDMSFIGPRPLLVSYLPYYTEREKKRHHVRPGITGLAQVSGRNNITLPERLDLDVQYVETLSFSNDIKIIIRTVRNVLSAKDITVVPSSKTLKDYREQKQV
jgi:lipopolysaccharide/colanic/teichoic acid biosynthesis glycosyltransferase